MIVAHEALPSDIVELSPEVAAWRATAKTRPASRRALRARHRRHRIIAETREGSEQLQADWKLERLPIAYALTEPSMREWGLFLSRERTDDELPLFNEPLERMTVDRS
jgi:hypothetical protein